MNLKTDFYSRSIQPPFLQLLSINLKHWSRISQYISPQTVSMTHVIEMPAAHFSNCSKHQMVI